MWAALFTAVLFLGGAQLVLIGVLGEYLGRISGEAKRRPLYLREGAAGLPVHRSTGHLRSGVCESLTSSERVGR